MFESLAGLPHSATDSLGGQFVRLALAAALGDLAETRRQAEFLKVLMADPSARPPARLGLSRAAKRTGPSELKRNKCALVTVTRGERASEGTWGVGFPSRALGPRWLLSKLALAEFADQLIALVD